MWEQFSAYHIDRLESAAASFSDRYDILAVEVATNSLTYAWTPVESTANFTREVLFPHRNCDEVPWLLKFFYSARAVLSIRPAAVFVCNQDQPEVISLTLLLRLLCVPTYAMFDAKFDDSPRYVFKEALKAIFLRLYNGAIVAGPRSVEYFAFLGLPKGWARTAFSTISIERIRSQAKVPLAPAGLEYASRDFIVVARFVKKKNLPLVIRAFARFAEMTAVHERPRRLVLCGSGALEAQLRSLVDDLGIENRVDFLGFLSHQEIAKQLSVSLAIVLPSIEEQWGLVINEAVALGIPVLCSENVGARDTLVRTGVNGYVFEPDNYEGLAALMRLLAEDESLWESLAKGSHRLAPAGDTAEFVRGVGKLLRIDVTNGQQVSTVHMRSSECVGDLSNAYRA